MLSKYGSFFINEASLKMKKPCHTIFKDNVKFWQG